MSAIDENLDLDRFRGAIAAAAGVEDGSLGDGDDPWALGLESIQVMRLVSRWRAAGATVKFSDLAECHTLAGWRQLVEQSVEQSKAAAPPEPDEPDDPPEPLTPVQQAYWVGRRADQPLGGVDAHFYVEFDGPALDPPRLAAAFAAVVAGHPMLRCRFGPDGLPEVADPGSSGGLRVHDLRQAPDGERHRQLAQRRAEGSRRRSDLERGQVVDLQLSLLPSGACRLHLNIDMLVADAQSFQVVLSDLARCYHRGQGLTAPGYSFLEYVADHHRQRATRRREAAHYWQDRLPQLPPPLELPLAGDPQKTSGQGIDRRFHWVPATEWHALVRHARSHGVSTSSALCAAFGEVLARWATSPRFLLILPSFDREPLHPEVDALVGDFTNLLVVALEAGRPGPFCDQAAALQRQIRASLSHDDYSGVEVLRDLGRRHPGRLLAPVVFTSAVNLGDLFPPAVRSQLGEPVWTISQTPQVFLDHQVTEHDGGVLLNWDVVPELFPPGMVDDLFGAYVELVGDLARESGTWDRPATIGLPASQAGVRDAVNRTTAPVPEAALHAGFFHQAAAHPDHVAVVDGVARVSYGQLADASLRVAAALVAAGAVSGDAVAVTLPKGRAQVEAVLGVLAAGCTYVPVGVDQPEERRLRMYHRAAARFLVTDAGDTDVGDTDVGDTDVGDTDAGAGTAPPSPAGLKVVTIEAARHHPPLAGPVPVDPGSVAYVIFTSGSTGEPKGVEISHRAAGNTVAAVNARFGLSAADRVLALSALDFDLSVYDLFGLFDAGGAVVLVAEEERKEARRWLEALRRHRVTVWNTVPALLDMLLVAAEGQEPLPTDLRLVLVSGDWVRRPLVDRLHAAAPSAQLVALGGATEAAIWSNAFEIGRGCTEAGAMPYGFPLANQRFRVVDESGRDRPDWCPGELWIGGAGLAEGYRGQPQLTAERFVCDEHEGRWYRTGDRGRYRPDGTLEFLGRADQQVKVLGHRIELGEVEAALARHSAVVQAVACVADEADPHLVAGVVTERPVSVDEVLALAARQLPGYMVPRRLIMLDSLPLTANGKVDRRRIQMLASGPPEVAAPDAEEAPRPGLESEVARLWASHLGTDGVGRDTNFFLAGGDSLKATRLVEAIRRAFGVPLSLRQLMEEATVRRVAAHIETTAGDFEQGEL